MLPPTICLLKSSLARGNDGDDNQDEQPHHEIDH